MVKLLRLTLRFYTIALEPEMDEEFREAFRRANNQRSLRPILQSMRSVQKRFEENSLARARCKRVLGREFLFEGFSFDQYEPRIDECRNFFAHSVADAVKKEGVTKVIESISVAVKLIEDLRTTSIIPALIIPTALGEDAYGRGIVWFLYEDEIKEDEWIAYGVRSYMYKDWKRLGEERMRLLHPYLCPYPVHHVDPVMYGMEEIMR